MIGAVEGDIAKRLELTRSGSFNTGRRIHRASRSARDGDPIA
jgi:hypothetical protein